MRSRKMDTISQCGMFVLLVFLLFEFSNCQQQEQQLNSAQLFQKYDEALQSVKSQDERVKNIFRKIQETNWSAEQFMEELQEQQKNFMQATKNFENIIKSKPTQKSAKDILNMRANFIESSKKVQETSKNYSQITQELYEQQKEFDQQLQILRKLEKNVTDIQKDLYIVTTFNITSDYTILEYMNMEPFEISENEFVDLLDTGVVTKAVLNFESNIGNKEFLINKTTTIIQGLHVKHAQKWDALKYIRFRFQDTNQKLIIEDAKFLGVGLNISCVQGGANEVYIEKLSVENSPSDGLFVQYCDTCKIENIIVKNSKFSGMEFYQVNNCTVDNATVLGAGTKGIYFHNSTAIIKNSFIQNSISYGIYVKSGQVTGQNVTFDGNGEGDTYGNYTTE